jgi:antitoxin component YwqK of YwqJK toxin-antitoxin module
MKRLVLFAALVFGAAALAGAMHSYLSHGESDATVAYHSNGSRKSSIVYLEGVKQGSSSQWYASGQLECEGSYSDGLRSGEWRFWNEQGELDLERSGTYADGHKVAPFLE